MFNPHLTVGQILTEKQVHDTFECQTTVGIRMSKKNNLFVIMSGSAKKKVYEDKWVGDTLFYNGTDINSDTNGQTLKKGRANNNSQLRDVWANRGKPGNPQVFLFVKAKANACVYKGEVDVGEPFTEPRHDDPTKTVWIFPLKLKIIESASATEDYEEAEKTARTLGKDKLKIRAINAEGSVPADVTQFYTERRREYSRNPDVAAYAKELAAGKCDLCGKAAPFNRSDGTPYLEAHHVKWLSRGGADDLTNVVALCPNCHRRMHELDAEEDVKKLKEIIAIEYESGERSN